LGSEDIKSSRQFVRFSVVSKERRKSFSAAKFILTIGNDPDRLSPIAYRKEGKFQFFRVFVVRRKSYRIEVVMRTENYRQ
jgi:hypothetical protein